MTISNKYSPINCQSSLIKVDTKQDGTRKYHCFDRDKRLLVLDSVTTILSGSASQENAIALSSAQRKWDKKYDSKKVDINWDTYCQNARTRGTQIHRLTELILAGEQDLNNVEIPEGFENIVDRIKQKSKSCQLLESEFFLYNTNSIIPYAGRADLYVEMYGKKYLIDIKTSDKPKQLEQWGYDREKKKRTKKIAAWYEKAVIQLTAYQLAMEHWNEYPEAIGIWVIHPEGISQYTIDIPKEERVQMWNERQEIYLSRKTSLINSVFA